MKNAVLRPFSAWTGSLLAVLGAATVPLLAPGPGEHLWILAQENFLTFLGFVPPIFVLLGLFDAWIPRERVVAHLGESSGWQGAGLALALGACAAGPLYVAFPIAALMLQKGAGRFPVFVFVGAWSTLKLPMALFEIQSLGPRFALTRYALSLGGVLAIAWLLSRLAESPTAPHASD